MTDEVNKKTDEKIYSLKEAAVYCGLSEWTLNKAIKDGHLLANTVSSVRGTKKYMVPESALFDWIEHRKEYRKPRTLKEKAFVIGQYKEMDINELAGELLNRINEAYRRGYSDGQHAAKVEMLKKLNEVGTDA